VSSILCPASQVHGYGISALCSSHLSLEYTGSRGTLYLFWPFVIACVTSKFPIFHISNLCNLVILSVLALLVPYLFLKFPLNTSHDYKAFIEGFLMLQMHIMLPATFSLLYE
jgi:hypothetical protein